MFATTFDHRHTKRPVLALNRWIEENTIRIKDYPGFLPEDLLTSHLECNDLSVLETILQLFFPEHGKAILLAKRVAFNYARVFCILLETQSLGYLEAFVDEDSLSDKYLPFDSTSRPSKFPVTEHLFSAFCNKQWRYCAADLQYMQSKDLHDKQPLPFTKKTPRGRGASSDVFEVEVAPRYNNLIPLRETQTDSSRFALKVFRGKRAKKAWEQECATFRTFQQGATTSTNVIDFYCAFTHKGEYCIILEYADKGSLETYLQNTRPPVHTAEILAFLEALMGLLQGLKELHEGKSRIWHQDIKPANILVLSHPTNKSSPYYCQLKIGDLGTSHSKQLSSADEDDTDNDAQGTKTYGAPECYRPNSFLGKGDIRVKLKVDLWSLGCVLSECLVWLVMGSAGIDQYAHARSNAISCLPGRNRGDYFHDSAEVLPTVSVWHTKVIDHPKNVNGILSDVVPLVESMLTVSKHREEAHFYCTKAHNTIESLKERFSAHPKPKIGERLGDLPLPTFPTTIIIKPGSPAPSEASTVAPGRRPTTMEPVKLPLRSARRKRQKPPNRTEEKPPYMSYEEALSWYVSQKASWSKVLPLRDSSALNLLADRDMVFIIDDSESMRPYWKKVQDLFRILAYILKSMDKDGLDLYFTSSNKKYHHNHTTRLVEEVERRGEVKNRGSNDMSDRLEQILGEHGTAIKQASRAGRLPKALNVYVFTDGKWDPRSNIVPSIDTIVNLMHTLQVPEKNVGLQFIRFGDYEEGLKKLRLVDNYLDLPLDIVDTTLSTGNLYKMLCGACRRWYDRYDETESDTENMKDEG